MCFTFEIFLIDTQHDEKEIIFFIRQKMLLTIGFEFQCVNGVRLVLYRLPDVLGDPPLLYYPNTRHKEKFEDDLFFYADRLSGRDKKAKAVAAYTALNANIDTFSLKTVPGGYLFKIHPEAVGEVVNNELEAVVTYDTPVDVSEHPQAILQFLLDSLTRASKNLINFLEHEDMYVSKLESSMKIKDLDIAGFTLLTPPGGNNAPGVALLLPKYIDTRYFKTDWLFNCQMTIGVPLTHVCTVVLTLCDVYMHLEKMKKARFHPEETTVVAMTKELIESIRRDKSIPGQLENIVFVVSYIVLTRAARKSSPFLFRHFIKSILTRATGNDTRLLHDILTAADKYTENRASTYVYGAPSQTLYQQTVQYQNLSQSALYVVHDTTVLIEFRYLSNVLACVYNSKIQNAQSLSELSRINRMKSKFMS
jgi:hypothetical protein